MKKICLLLALIFALTCLPALAAEGDAIVGRSEEDMVGFTYCFGVGDTLYLVSYMDIATYHLGDADLTRYEFDLPQSNEESYSYDVATLPFAEGGKLYALNLVTKYEENAEFEGAKLMELELRDDGVAYFTEVCDVDWSDMVEYYEDSSYPIRPDNILGAGGKAFIRYYDLQGDYRMVSMDLASGKLSQIDGMDAAYMVAPYGEDALLVELFDYNVGDVARLAVYTPADNSLQMLSEIAVENYSPLMGLAYDPAGDTVYCIKGGEICPVDLQAGEIGAGVTDMPLDVYGSAPGVVLEGGFYAYAGDGAVIRNLDPAQKAQTRIKINDSYWNDSVSTAYYRFANAHGDISVVLSREYSESANIIESMMNRDSSVDIYLLSTSSSAFEALYNRGYLMELDGSAAVRGLADRMYPTLRESLSSNGHLVALPVALNGWTMGINERALEQLGLTMADVPDNWSDFLDFLAGLAGRLGDESGVSLYYSGYTAADARYDLMVNIFEDYHRYFSASDPAAGYNTDLLRGLLEKLEDIDFVALGCAEEEAYEDDENIDYLDYSSDIVLLQTGTGCSIGNFYSEFTPILMKVEAGAPERLVLETTVAIVNPYTQNPDAALAFMDELANDLSTATLYCLDPALNEPIRGDVNQETLNEMQMEADMLRQEYEKASAADKQALEPQLNEVEDTLEYFDTYLWEVSPRELEWYRAHDDSIVTAGFNWLYAEEGGEALDLMEQYRGGQIGVREMLEGIDNKVRMMMLEGN